MVKEFKLKYKFPVTSEIFFTLFLSDPSFKTAFHHSRGDSDVDVSDWVAAGPAGDKYRMAVYTLVVPLAQGGSSSPSSVRQSSDSPIKLSPEQKEESTRCLEKQNHSIDGDIIKFKCSITPDNPMGNIFKIESTWKISPSTNTSRAADLQTSSDKSDKVPESLSRQNSSLSTIPSSTSLLSIDESEDESSCQAELTVMVECTKRMWGVQSMIENILYDQAMQLHDGFFQYARKCCASKLREYNDEKARQALIPRVSYNSNSIFDWRIRSKSRSNYANFISGTSLISRLLSEEPTSPTESTLQETASWDTTFIRKCCTQLNKSALDLFLSSPHGRKINLNAIKDDSGRSLVDFVSSFDLSAEPYSKYGEAEAKRLQNEFTEYLTQASLPPNRTPRASHSRETAPAPTSPSPSPTVARISFI